MILKFSLLIYRIGSEVTYRSRSHRLKKTFPDISFIKGVPDTTLKSWNGKTITLESFIFLLVLTKGYIEGNVFVGHPVETSSIKRLGTRPTKNYDREVPQ